MSLFLARQRHRSSDSIFPTHWLTFRLSFSVFFKDLDCGVDAAEGEFGEVFDCGISGGSVKFSVKEFVKIGVVCVMFGFGLHGRIIDQLLDLVK